MSLSLSRLRTLHILFDIWFIITLYNFQIICIQRTRFLEEKKALRNPSQLSRPYDVEKRETRTLIYIYIYIHGSLSTLQKSSPLDIPNSVQWWTQPDVDNTKKAITISLVLCPNLMLMLCFTQDEYRYWS